MRIVTLNVNGIRASARKGLFEWLALQQADVVCLQETKAQIDQLQADTFHPSGYHCHYYDAQRKGYSGVALYSRQKPDELQYGFGVAEFDDEGRYLEARFPHCTVVSLYAPSGSASAIRQQSKQRFMDAFETQLQRLQKADNPCLICGDWNIAHRQIDLENWRGNQKNSGFLPEERAWMDSLFGPWGYADAFRTYNPAPQEYSWWSNRGQARAKNVGWRIDYQVISNSLKEDIQKAWIDRQQSLSDHAPVLVDYNHPL